MSQAIRAALRTQAQEARFPGWLTSAQRNAFPEAICWRDQLPELGDVDLRRRAGEPQVAAAAVLELDQRRATRRDRHGLMPTRERLQLRLLIGADDVLARVQQPTFKAPCVEIQDAAGLGLEVGIAREDPTAVIPRTDRVLM